MESDKEKIFNIYRPIDKQVYTITSSDIIKFFGLGTALGFFLAETAVFFGVIFLAVFNSLSIIDDYNSVAFYNGMGAYTIIIGYFTMIFMNQFTDENKLIWIYRITIVVIYIITIVMQNFYFESLWEYAT